jgi:hypothetical protein
MFKTALQIPDASGLASGDTRSAPPWTDPARQSAARSEFAARVPVLTGSQVRAARALLQWTAESLAIHAQVGVATIRRAERIDGPVRCLASINLAMRRTLEAAGVEFTSENGLTGVRIRTGLG